MKVLKTLLLLGTIFFLFFLVSCAEEENPAPAKSELLAGDSNNGRSYFISSAEIDLDAVDGTLVLDECVTDNTIIYYPSGRYDENEGRTKCNAEDPPGTSGNWTFLNDETQIVIELEGERHIWDIESINSNSHRISRATNDGQLTFVLERLF